MFKFALIVVVVFISKPEKQPSITFSALYDDINSCHQVMDQLVKNINAEEGLDKNGDRILRLYNREYHNQSIIYWSCKKSKKNKES